MQTDPCTPHRLWYGSPLVMCGVPLAIISCSVGANREKGSCCLPTLSTVFTNTMRRGSAAAAAAALSRANAGAAARLRRTSEWLLLFRCSRMAEAVMRLLPLAPSDATPTMVRPDFCASSSCR
jgi:hypothetical protein